MAEIVPDRLPNQASAGEKRLFAILQGLPEDYLVYYEPVVADRHPDFVLFAPPLGLLTIEVKGWYPRDIRSADTQNLLIGGRGGERRERHPLRQARDYMFRLMDHCRKNDRLRLLLHPDGDREGRFLFPFGHFAILSNITAVQLREHPLGDLSPVFPAERVVTREQFLEWEALSGEALVDRLKAYFEPRWPFQPLDPSQLDTLRAALHPELVVARDDDALTVMDLRQEGHARSLGHGHRVIYGVAGSGKTLILIARARLIAEQDPQARVLLLCYNVPLAAYLRDRLGDCPGIQALHFDEWAKQHGAARQRGESDQALGHRLLDRLASGEGDSRNYRAVLVDEAQDFDPSWFLCVLEAMEDPHDGDLVIVADGAQSLYQKRRISWKALGISAAGRTLSKRLDLDRCYRSSQEVLALAELFAADGGSDEDSLLSVIPDLRQTPRSTGLRPLLHEARDRDAEVAFVVATVSDLLAGRWRGGDIEALKPEQIALLYPRLERSCRAPLAQLIERLSKLAPLRWLSDPEHRERRLEVTAPGIKVQTIHSAKGLQYRAVILLWADLLPGRFADSDIERERRLLYVGLTRAEDLLCITAAGDSPFIEEIAISERIERVS